MSALHAVVFDGRRSKLMYQQAAEQLRELEAALRSAVSERDAEVERAVQAEREACAKVCDENSIENELHYAEIKNVISNPNDFGALKFVAYAGQADRDAAAIRARGEKGAK